MANSWSSSATRRCWSSLSVAAELVVEVELRFINFERKFEEVLVLVLGESWVEETGGGSTIDFEGEE